LIAARIDFRLPFGVSAILTALFCFAASTGHGQATASASLPDAPQSQTQTAPDAQPQAQIQSQTNTQNTQPQAPSSAQAPQSPTSAAQNGSAQSSSNSQPSAQQSGSQPSQREQGEQEVREQEKQRVEGIVPTFNVTYHQNAVPLTPGQKMNLSLHSALDPFTVASAFITAGYHEADNDLKGFDWGPEGFFERTGVAYLDTFDSTILSTGVFPIIFRQDPRYFRLGVGSTGHRILYSLSTNFIARNDYGRRGWGPNYGNVLGNFAAGELSNFYYPKGNSSFSLAATNTVVQIAEGAGGSIFNEFWPDISRRLFHKDPSHGLDAEAKAAYAAQQEQKKAGDPARPGTPPQPAQQVPPSTPANPQ
jgi:hypothetical protein